MALQTQGLHTCPLYSWGRGSDSVALPEVKGGDRGRQGVRAPPPCLTFPLVISSL